MEDVKIESVQFSVPVDQGHLIGNTLRQFAMRGTRTWQPAGYRVVGKEGSFGLGGGNPFSYLEFLKGHIISSTDAGIITEKRCQFMPSSDGFVCDGMILKGLDGLGFPSIDVCLVYDSGARTVAQNYNVVRNLCQQEAKDFTVVPSKHTPAIKFKFRVEPYDRNSETLIIEATPGTVEMALESAVTSLRSLERLHI